MKKWSKNEVLTADDLNGAFEEVSKLSNSSELKAKSGLIISVVGDSISTQFDINAVEIEISEQDIGVELSAYATHFDVGTTIAGHKIVESDVGKELTFTPTSSDVGKKIGLPKNYNTKVWQTWWQYIEHTLGCEVLPVCWSGSSMSSHENTTNQWTGAHAWHDSQIRKMGKRIPGSMNRLSPDVIILYRGTNDMTHAPYSKLTDGYFDDNVNWKYPSTDVVSDGYGVKEAYALTIKKIRETYPNAQIVLATLNNFRRINYNKFPVHNGDYGIPEYNAAIREVADFFGCQTIDFDKDGVTYENCYEEGYITDSSTIPTHPNNKGHLFMGKQAVCDLVNKLHICDLVPLNAEDTRLFTERKLDNTLIDSTGAVVWSSTKFDVKEYHSILYSPVEAGKTYYIQYGRNYVFLDENENVLASGNVNSLTPQWKIKAPNKAVYMHICGKYEDISSEDFKVVESN